MNGSEDKHLIGEVLQVFSGDDLIVLVDLQVESLFKKQRVRLFGVDAPNAVRSKTETAAGQIRAYVRALCKNRKIELKVISRGAASWVVTAWVVTENGLHNLNEDLIAQGYAYKRES